MADKPSFFDKLKAKADEMHLKEKVDEFADQADKLTRQAASKVGEVTHDNRDKVEGFLDKAASKVDETTGGKYHDKVVKARESASKGVGAIADQRDAAADTSGSATPGSVGEEAPAAAPATAPAEAAADELAEEEADDDGMAEPATS